MANIRVLAARLRNDRFHAVRMVDWFWTMSADVALCLTYDG